MGDEMNNMFGNLFGSLAPQPDPTLQQYYDPKAAMWNAIGGGLQGAGAGLASGKPGAWAQGLVIGSGQGLDNYKENTGRRAAAAKMLEEADAKKQERAQAEEERKRRQEYIQQFPADVQVKMLSIPGYMEKYIEATDPAFQKPDKPDMTADIQNFLFAQQYPEFSGFLKGEQKPSIENPLSITKDYEGQAGFKGIKTVAPTINSMVKSLDDPSAMADLDFVYGLAKILDPTSVVRESEGKMVIDSQGIAPSLLGQLNKIATGEQAMLPATRRKLLGVAMRRANEFRAQAEQERQFYTGIASQNGYDPNTYVQPVPQLPSIPPMPVGKIPPDAIKELLRDPSPQAKQEFDQVFGPGAADSILRR